MNTLLIIIALGTCILAEMPISSLMVAPVKKVSNFLPKEKLDSIVQVDDLKVECVYNNEGRATQVIYSIWELGRWKKHEKFEYSYDSNGNIVLFVRKTWSFNNWSDRIKDEYTYDTSNNLSSIIYYRYGSTQWDQDNKFEYTYDNANIITLMMLYDWNSDQWEARKKNEYTSNFLGFITGINTFTWDSTHWENYDSSDYKWNTNLNIIIEKVSYAWYSDEWINGSKYNNTFNDKGNTTSFTKQAGYFDEWFNVEKSEYSYDSSDNVTEQINYRWTGEQWLFQVKSSMVYDFSSDYSDIAFPIVVLYNMGTAYTVKWSALFDIYTQPSISFPIQPWYGTITNKPDSGIVQSWDTTTSSWDSGTKIYYYYSPFIVPIINDPQSIGKHTSALFTIQCNKPGSKLSFTNNSGSAIDLSIFALNGKRVKRIVVPATGLVTDISFLASGIYFVKNSDGSSISAATSFVKW